MNCVLPQRDGLRQSADRSDACRYGPRGLRPCVRCAKATGPRSAAPGEIPPLFSFFGDYHVNKAEMRLIYVPAGEYTG